MARPRKNQTEPLAQQRIKTALWELLEEHDLKEITISMVTTRACCNRGTFYYHFDSIDELMFTMIREELLGTPGLPLELLFLFCDEETQADLTTLTVEQAQRFGLIMQRAGNEYVAHKVKAVVVRLWHSVLCDGEDCLAPETMTLIEYSVSGIIGSIDYLYREGLFADEILTETLMENIRTLSHLMVQHIAVAQGLSYEELQTRIRLLGQVACMKQQYN